MSKCIDWIKKNKFASFLLLIVLLLLFRQSSLFSFLINRSTFRSAPIPSFVGGDVSFSPKISTEANISSPQTNRLVIEESYLSLVVSDVRKATDKVVEIAEKFGGFMVSSSLNQLQEAPFATVVLRVPAKNLKQVLNDFRSLANKVSSENLQGTDVTERYTDIQAKLATLEKTKAKFEEILAKAQEVQDILQVQRELVNLQEQIDSLKGEQQYLQKTAELAKITLYLSTDELSLPYTPSGTFRPKLIFKQAVRALIQTFRFILKVFIWIIVFIPIWGLFLLTFTLIKRRKKIS